MLGKYSTTELNPQPSLIKILRISAILVLGCMCSLVKVLPWIFPMDSFVLPDETQWGPGSLIMENKLSPLFWLILEKKEEEIYGKIAPSGDSGSSGVEILQVACLG